MRLRYLIEHYQRYILVESTRYDPMFSAILKIVRNFKPSTISYMLVSNIEESINWATRTLKREDRVVWFLRWSRFYLIRSALMDIRRSNDVAGVDMPKYSQQLSQLYNKYEKELFHLTSGNLPDMSIPRIDSMKIQLQHYLSLPVPAIQNVIFTNQTPVTLVGANSILEKLENEWKRKQEKKAQHLQPQEGDQKIIDFGNGWAWWLLNRAFCPEEAKAMGHCGNEGAYETEERILSLRKQGAAGYRPSLTFILDAEGYLGEMKGRGNDKPAEQYYPYIIKLLENPLIKGIVGGGYLPENNFDLSDLDDADIDRLIEMKPELANASLLYKRFGVTDQFVQKVIKEIAQSELSSLPKLDWDNELKLFIVHRYDDVYKLIEDYGNDSMKRMVDGDVFDYYNFYDWVNDDAKFDLFTHLHQLALDRIAEYINKKYPREDDDNQEENDYDDREMFDILNDNDDDIINILDVGLEEGYRTGTEKDAWESMRNSISSGFSYDGVAELTGITYTNTIAEERKSIDIDMNGPCIITIDPPDIVNALDDDAIMNELIEYNSWVGSGKLTLEEPYNGWSGYDDKSAIEIVMETLPSILNAVLGNPQ
jgi:hypothetical protein